jgi:hypothetical protein
MPIGVPSVSPSGETPLSISTASASLRGVVSLLCPGLRLSSSVCLVCNDTVCAQQRTMTLCFSYHKYSIHQLQSLGNA